MWVCLCVYMNSAWKNSLTNEKVMLLFKLAHTNRLNRTWESEQRAFLWPRYWALSGNVSFAKLCHARSPSANVLWPPKRSQIEQMLDHWFHCAHTHTYTYIPYFELNAIIFQPDIPLMCTVSNRKLHCIWAYTILKYNISYFAVNIFSSLTTADEEFWARSFFSASTCHNK